MGLRFACYFVPSLDWFWLWSCTYYKLPVYPGKHPHSVSLMILIDLGLLGLVFYHRIFIQYNIKDFTSTCFFI